jgi:hypothetical protein
MPDHFGALEMPVPPAPKGPVGDPALDVLGAFLAAVITAELGAAWEPLAPGRPVVRRVFSHSVSKRRFVKEDMPSLFVFRSGPGKTEAYTADAYKRTQTVLVQWVYPPALNEHQVDRDPFMNALGGVLERAVYRGRDAAWVIPSDRAAPEALVLPVATSTKAVTLRGKALTGALAHHTVNAARSVTVTTSPSVGAYSVGAPILVIGRDKRGRVLRDAVVLAAAHGGETVPTLWRFCAVSEIRLPPMASSSGRIVVGYAASPEVALGSLVERHAGLFKLEVEKPAEVKPLLVPIKNPETRGNEPPMPFEMVELALSIEELLEEDAARHYKPITGAIAGRRSVAKLVGADGVVVDEGDLD